MQKTIQTILSVMAVLLLIAGVVIMAYPTVNGAMVDSSLMREAATFLEQMNVLPAEKDTLPQDEDITANVTEEMTIKHKALWDAMVSYNTNIYENHQVETENSGVFAHSPFTLTDYDLENDIFGVLTIPAIELEMPIFLGASEENMIAGCAVLNQTSMPIGGINTNAVIGGHRGYQGAEYFLHVPDLVPGDEVIVTNLWETLTYRVVDKEIIDPYAVNEILIQEGKDMITLMTCHPYASGGKQRYLIYCERVPQAS